MNYSFFMYKNINTMQVKVYRLILKPKLIVECVGLEDGLKHSRKGMIEMEEREFINEEEELNNSIDNEQGFAFAYNLTMVASVATVAMFVIGTALYLTIVG